MPIWNPPMPETMMVNVTFYPTFTSPGLASPERETWTELGLGDIAKAAWAALASMYATVGAITMTKNAIIKILRWPAVMCPHLIGLVRDVRAPRREQARSAGRHLILKYYSITINFVARQHSEALFITP